MVLTRLHLTLPKRHSLSIVVGGIVPQGMCNKEGQVILREIPPISDRVVHEGIHGQNFAR
jgi:hypothetical protein